MNLTGTIESAEKEFKQILEEFFIAVYTEESLPSHGIDHHRRVWNYAKELLKLFSVNNSGQIAHLVPELIIASYLHDIGMSVDPGLRHGKHSRELCIQFFRKNNYHVNEWTDVLDAIENHDNKDYISNASGNELLTILSVADDLDAFGFTGVFRYSEIYLTRKITPEKLGYLIIENAGKRYDNFGKTIGSDSEIYKKHCKRFYILDDFFRKYNDQLHSYQFGTPNPSGYCGVIEIFLNSMNKKLKPDDMFKESMKYSDDPIILWFFEQLQKEILAF
jgi:HD superfamily phosphohydrolase YqeK